MYVLVQKNIKKIKYYKKILLRNNINYNIVSCISSLIIKKRSYYKLHIYITNLVRDDSIYYVQK